MSMSRKMRKHRRSGKSGNAKSQTALRRKQIAFVNEYLRNGWNATQAAIKAGYSKRSARSIGSENLTKPDIREQIDERLRAAAMGANEVLARLAHQARGTIEPFLAKDGRSIDVTSPAAKENLPLLKKYKVTHGVTKSGQPWTSVEIELYDAQSALEKIARHLGLFKEIGDPDRPLNVKLEDMEAVRQKRWQQVGPALAGVLTQRKESDSNA